MQYSSAAPGDAAASRRRSSGAGLGRASASRGGAVAAAAGLPHPQGRPAIDAALRAARRAEAVEEFADGADAVLLGVKRNDPEDYALAADLAARLASAAKRPVAVGLDAMPLGSSLRDAASWPSGLDSVDFLQPIADLQQRSKCDLVPLGVQAEVMGAVQRSGGIAALSEQQRNAYVDDVGAFVRYPKQTAAFDVWAERVVARTYKRRYGAQGR